MKPGSNSCYVFFGTYTNGQSEGIYVCELNLDTGILTDSQFWCKADNPSYIAIDQKRHILYVANEVDEFMGKPGGAVSSYAIDQASGELIPLSQCSTLGAGPCHIALDSSGNYVFAANYVDGSVAVIACDRAGRLNVTDYVKFEGGGSKDPLRQDRSHPHSCNVDYENQFVLVPDLGSDRVYSYKFDSKNGKLSPGVIPFCEVVPGAGPRHWAFGLRDQFAYGINELNSTISTYGYDKRQGSIQAVQSVSTLPSDFAGENLGADIHLHPSGSFLYASNRGHDSLVIYSVDRHTGLLSYVDHQSTYGRTPRNFCIDPFGFFLLVANQDSDNIVVFRIDRDTGCLTKTGCVAEIPQPVCIRLYPVRS